MDLSSIQEIANMCGGTLLKGNPHRTAGRFSKDTRTLEAGDVYVALRGEHFDGNQFLAVAEARGAVAAIIDDPSVISPRSQLAIISVADSLLALQQLAAAWRKRISPKVVCITGSTGKTTTKDFTAAVLASRYSVSQTQGTYNNHIGVPLTILQTSSADETAVWEIGTNHPGEILPLAQLVLPRIAIITNIGVAHIEHFGAREAIAEEKGNLIPQISPGGRLILSSDDDFSEQFASRSPVPTILVGMDSGSITASDIKLRLEGTEFIATSSGENVPVFLPVSGRHMVKNALFALAAGIELGVPLAEGAAALSTATLTGARLRLIEVHGVHFLDDSYNANPKSMIAAVETAAEIPCRGRRFAVLGEMGELGPYTQDGYHQVGRATAAASFDFLLAVGEKTHPLAEAAKELQNVHQLADTSAAAKFLRHVTKPGDLVLVKGSKSAQMGRVIEQFKSL
ncbi:MAG: UDP-N-acetylmuramoyl-tripeptide--D-alanyl-D-alanine ligase [Verrucomicrobia bacterium]|nr:MAG: UDP-N-acetylmuramoyl-tripeptide--D-alanyl-D-alanine ligase [Verrucomicrobiota bacterium]